MASNSNSSKELRVGAGEGTEVSLEPVAKVTFSQKQFAHHIGTFWDALFWTPTGNFFRYFNPM